jgi:hypothetical protein
MTRILSPDNVSLASLPAKILADTEPLSTSDKLEPERLVHFDWWKNIGKSQTETCCLAKLHPKKQT